MTQTTLEGNKLIANSPFCSDETHDAWAVASHHGALTAFYSGLKYHSSWDWLMPVVQKILKTDTGTLDVYSLYVSDALRTADINEVFQACINFIQWFNTQPPTP